MSEQHDIAAYRANPHLAPARMRRDLAAAVADVHVRSIDRWARLGFIKASRPAGGIVLVDRDSLIRFLERGVAA